MYAVKTLRINYTTYDIRRDHDTINPRTDHCNIMVRSPVTEPDEHPFWYARVLGLFHAKVMRVEPNRGSSQPMFVEFLWVRWYGVVPGYRSGIHVAKLPKIGFVEDSDEFAFGFVDPSLIIRACHLIPAFASGRTVNLLRTRELTAARRPEETDDWEDYYVMMLVRSSIPRVEDTNHVTIQDLWTVIC